MTESGKSLLGIDYGVRRIGVACGDQDRCLAFALATHVEGKDGSVLKYLAGIIGERGIRKIVVGLPLTSEGQESDSSRRARRFAQRLEEEFGLPVVLWDERYSSQEADRWLAASSSREKTDRDALAAEIILQSYLDSRKPADPSTEAES
jgi:putative pre-16S rRNA nuclease